MKPSEKKQSEIKGVPVAMEELEIKLCAIITVRFVERNFREMRSDKVKNGTHAFWIYAGCEVKDKIIISTYQKCSFCGNVYDYEYEMCPNCQSIMDANEPEITKPRNEE